jgi:transposase
MCNKIEIPLDIENIDVKQVTFTEANEILIEVESTEEYAYCYRCGKKISKYHSSNRETKLRHLPILGKKTYLLISPKRYECESCPNNPTTTQRVEWYSPRSHYTKAYQQHLLLLLINSTITDVCCKEELGYGAIEGLLNRVIGQEINWAQITAIKNIGIDEIALKKGHGNFVTLITLQHDNHRIQLLGILENREKETVKNFFLSIPSELRGTVENVCTDLYDGYIYAAREIFGEKVNIIADRFHVARLYRKSVDQLRKKETKRLKKELSSEEYNSLHNAMWIIRKNPKQLSDEEKETRQKLFDYSPELKFAYLFSRVLTAIFDDTLSPSQAQSQLMAWIDAVQENNIRCFDTFLNTVNRYMTPITNYFIARKNSGFVEGFNNKVKVIKRRCYGIFNRIHLFQRITLDLAGYELFT